MTEPQQATVAASSSAAEVRLDHAATEATELDLVFRTYWHRKSTVVAGAVFL